MFLKSGFLASFLALSAHAGEYKALNCEFFVNSIGRYRTHYLGFSQEGIEAFLSVNEDGLVKAQGGKILEVGAFVGGPAGARVIKGSLYEPAYYLISFPTETHHQDGRQEMTPASELAFYVDILRSAGVVDRLWLTAEQRNFSVAEIFGNYPVISATLGLKSVEYVSDVSDSPIYAQKKLCVH